MSDESEDILGVVPGKLQRRLLRYREVAEILCVSTRHVHRMVAAREIPVVKISSRAVRFDPRDVELFVRRAKTKANGRRWAFPFSTEWGL